MLCITLLSSVLFRIKSSNFPTAALAGLLHTWAVHPVHVSYFLSYFLGRHYHFEQVTANCCYLSLRAGTCHWLASSWWEMSYLRRWPGRSTTRCSSEYILSAAPCRCPKRRFVRPETGSPWTCPGGCWEAHIALHLRETEVSVGCRLRGWFSLHKLTYCLFDLHKNNVSSYFLLFLWLKKQPYLMKNPYCDC